MASPNTKRYQPGKEGGSKQMEDNLYTAQMQDYWESKVPVQKDEAGGAYMLMLELGSQGMRETVRRRGAG